MPRKKLADLERQNKVEISPEKLEKLRQWGFKKGESGNPGGRPVGTVRLSTAIQAVSNRINEKTGLTHLQTLLIVMFIEAIEGDKETREMLFDRGYGTLIQKNMLMGLTGDLVKFAKELGLDANDLTGSDTVRGLLQATADNPAGFEGDEGDSGQEAPGSPAAIENNPENS